MDRKESFIELSKMELIISYKNEMHSPATSSLSPRSPNREVINSFTSIIEELELRYNFRLRNLRRIARSQLFILLKKYIYNNSPELYLGEIHKLLQHELKFRSK